MGWALGLAVLLLPIAGCYATSGEGEVEVAYPAYRVTVLPPAITTYPSVLYDGRPAYWVDGHWYYAGSDGWVVFRNEPPTLYEARRSLPARARVRVVTPPVEEGRRYQYQYPSQPAYPAVPASPPVEERRRYYPQ